MILREEAKLLMYSEEERETEYSVAVEHSDSVIDEIYDSFEPSGNRVISQGLFGDSSYKAQLVVLGLSKAGLLFRDKLMQDVTISYNCINDETEENIEAVTYLSGFTDDVLFSSIKSFIDEKSSEFKYIIVHQVESGVKPTPFELK